MARNIDKQKSEKYMSPLHDLIGRAAKNGYAMKSICKDAGLNQCMISKWKKTPPLYVHYLAEIEKAIEKHEAAKGK